MDIIEKSVNIFKTLGDLTRFQIITTLINGEKPVSMIASEIKKSQSAVSHQLKILKDNDLVKSERRGKEVYYDLVDQHVKVIIEQIYNHASHSINE
jgi:DNA-binding transcriptional ArsR family regulator